MSKSIGWEGDPNRWIAELVCGIAHAKYGDSTVDTGTCIGNVNLYSLFQKWATIHTNELAKRNITYEC